MSVRVATVEDAEALRSIYAPFVLESPATFDMEPPSRTYFRDKIEDLLRHYPVLVFERNSEVVGYCYGSSHHQRPAYRWSVDVSIYLSDNHQGQGIGKQLYGQLLAVLAQQGFRTALAGITLPNAASVGLHESFGFQPVARLPRVGYKLGAWRDVGWWSLDLAPDLESPREPIPFPVLTS